MEKGDKLKALLLSLRNYYNYLEEYSKIWTQTSQKTREKERDLLALSDQLRCLSMHNETNLSATEIRRTMDRVTLIMEEKFGVLLATLESMLKMQEGLTTLRLSLENQYEPLEGSDIVQQLMKLTYVSWLSLQIRSSTIDAAIRTVHYKSPETIRLLLQKVSGSDLITELKDTMETAENVMLLLESCARSSMT